MKQTDLTRSIRCERGARSTGQIHDGTVGPFALSEKQQHKVQKIRVSFSAAAAKIQTEQLSLRVSFVSVRALKSCM